MCFDLCRNNDWCIGIIILTSESWCELDTSQETACNFPTDELPLFNRLCLPSSCGSECSVTGVYLSSGYQCWEKKSTAMPTALPTASPTGAVDKPCE